MGMATGAKSSVKIGIESTWGTPADKLKYLSPFTSESLNKVINAIKSEAILNYRATRAIAPGEESVEGSLEMEFYPSAGGVIFYLALGKAEVIDPDGTAGSGDEYVKITPIGVSEDLPSATIAVNHGGVQTFYYTGLKVRSLNFEGAVGSNPKLSLDMIGQDELSSASITEELEELDKEPFYFKEILLSKDGANYTVDTYSDIKFTINNNPAEDIYVLDGTGKRVDIPAGDLQITGSATLLFNSETLGDEYNKYKNWTEIGLHIKLEKAGGKKFIISLPRLYITKASHDIGDKGKITLPIEFEAVKPETGDIIEVYDYIHHELY